MKQYGVYLILLFAFVGLADAAYLAQHAASGAPLICDIQSLSDCNTVASSPYSRIFGIPIADFGLIFYGALFVLAAFEIFYRNRAFRRALQAAALIGVLSSAYFTYLQIFQIHALCIYCLMSAAISILVFISASLIEPVRRRAAARPAAPFSMPPEA